MSTKIIALPAHTAPSLPAWEVWLLKHKQLLEVVGGCILILALLTVLAQVVYPADRALPFMRIGGVDIGSKNRAALIAQLTDYAQKGEATISSPSKQWKAKWQSIGLSVDPQATAEVALSYDITERLIPFSGLIRIWQAHEMSMIAVVDHDRLTAFASKLVTEDKQAAQDATIEVKDGKVAVNEAKTGYSFSVDDVKQQVQAAAISTDTTLRLAPRQIPFTRSAEELEKARAAAEAVLAHKLTLKVGDKTFEPGAAAIGSWLAFSEDPKTKTLGLGFHPNVMRAYLEGLDEQTKIAAGTSTVTLLDGQEIARTPAASGHTVATDESLKQIEAALLKDDPNPALSLAITAVSPKLTYVRTYSQTSEGILNIIKDWESAHYGNYAVIVRELGGENRYAEWQPDKSYVTSSTFKLFVYYALQQRIQAGSISYGQRTDMGWTVEACLEEMIVRSTNPCAVSFMNLMGWQAAQDTVAAAGFSNTNINNQFNGDKHSTIRDETNYMLRLYHGTLMGPEATQRLLGYLKRQIWRSAIPSGVPAGTVVADKPGLYNGWVHDVAIVYGPKMPYILGIFSQGGSDPAFVDLSRRMYDFFQK